MTVCKKILDEIDFPIRSDFSNPRFSKDFGRIEIGNMTNLEQIILSDSEVSVVPDEIGNLTNLKRFNLSRTKVSTLPESMKNLKNLKMLNIKKTNISASELAKIKSWLPNCKIKF